MTTDDQLEQAPCSRLGARAYVRLLDEAKHISEWVLERLHGLSSRFPTTLPADLIEQVERIHDDPSCERRRCPRLPDNNLSATVTAPTDLTGWTSAPVIDRSPGGLALLLADPVEAGTVLLVWFGSADEKDAWYPVEVKHCRQEGEGWIVGAELLRGSDKAH